MAKNIALFILLLSSVNSFGQSKSQSSWQQKVDYLIDVQLDDVNHMLNGEIAISYTNNSPDVLNEIYIHLWPNGYASDTTAFAQQMKENGDLDFYYSKEEDRGFIDNLDFKANGKSLIIKGTKDVDVIRVQLDKPLKSGGKTTLFTPFRVKLPKVFSRLGHKDQDYFITQWYPKPAVYDVNGWNPMPYLNLGEFYSEFGTFKVNVTLPENYTIVATGECQTLGELTSSKSGLADSVPPSSSKLKTIQFTASDVHDFAWFASKRWGYVTSKIKVGDREVLARVVAAEPDVGDLTHIGTAIKYYSENVGVYPYSHATVVHGELKAGGGMEYPMITLCDFMNEEVIVHEVGHNWFYGILATNERTYPWMDEAINSYYESEAMKKGTKSVSDATEGIMMAFIKDNLLRRAHQAIATPSAELTEANYGMSVYGIGAKSFGYLKAYLGDDLFKQCMLTYYETWKFKHPLPDDMKKSFEATSGQSLSWFFDAVLQNDEKLDYEIKSTKEGFILSNVGDVEAPVPVQFGEKEELGWYSVKPGEALLIQSNGEQEKAYLDKDGVTLDLHKGNNSSSTSVGFKPFFGRDKVGVREVYVAPLVGWNAYDKAMLGVGFHNYSIGDKALQYHVFPMYSFEKKSLNGTAGINYTMPLKGKAEFLEIGADAKSFNYLERGFKQEYKYLKLAPYLRYNFAKKSQRSPVQKSLELQLDQLFFKPQFYIERDTLIGPESVPIESSRNFVTLSYNLENKRSINGYSWNVMAEFGKISQSVIIGDTANRQPWYDVYDTAGNFQYTRMYSPFLREDKVSQNLARISTIFKYNVDIGMKDKPLEFRAYAAYILENVDKQGQYQNTIGSTDKAGYYDYRFDDYLLHRNATYGVFQNQISNRRDFSKFVGSIVNNETWLMNFNVTVPLPGKIPVKPYFEVMMYEDLDKESWNTAQSKLIYNLGLELELIPDRFEIFLNLAQSSDVTEYQENLFYPSNIGGFAERITFVLDINNLMPNKLKRQVKLF